MVESRPIEITFDAKKNLAGLEIIAALNTADDFGNTAIEIVAGNVQAAACPSAAEIDARIKSIPVIGWRGDRSFVERRFGRKVGCKRGRAEKSSGRNGDSERYSHLTRPRIYLRQ